MSRLDPEVLQRFIKESGISYKQNGRSYLFTCPRCSKKNKLYIDRIKGSFICWKCAVDGFKGRPEFALSALTGRSVASIKEILYGDGNANATLYLDIEIKDFFDDNDEIDPDATPLPTMDWPVDYYPIDDPKSARGVEYLKGRGIPLWLAKQYGLRYCPVRRRVGFPISLGSSLYGYQERLVIPEEWVDENGEIQKIPKVLTSSSTPKDKTLMFWDRLRGTDHAVLCEGPVDAIKAHFCGGNVCAMGKNVSEEQINALLNAGVKKLYLALDPDAASDVQRIVDGHFGDVEMYMMVAKGSGNEKADLGAMGFEEVYELFLGAPKIGPGYLAVYIKDQVFSPLK
jgi:hypothetical protein